MSYTPFIWHPDVKLHISADRDDVTTVYVAGDHLSKEFYPEFQNAVRQANEEIKAMQAGNESNPKSDRATRRSNIKTLRHLTPLAIKNEWMTEEQITDDAFVVNLWEKVATGQLQAKRWKISDENLAIIRQNVALLDQHTKDDPKYDMPELPLLRLIPEGVPANPVYLPAPHEVLVQGWKDWTTPPEEGTKSLTSRYFHSLRIVAYGFLLSCLIGVPLGILCGTYDFFSKLFEPFIDFFRYMPAPAFSTLLVAVFLAHDAPKVALVFIGTFFQMVLVISKTTSLLDTSLLEAAQTLGAKNRHLLARVIVPGVLPNLYNDLRILLGWSWTWLVIAELIGVKSGLTEFIETQGRWRNFDRVFPIIILIGVTGFFTDQLLSLIRPLLFPWLEESRNRKGILKRFFKKTQTS